MSEHRDPTVADALRRLDVPDHGPGFWDRLEANLTEPPEVGHAAHPGPAGGSDAEVVELADAPSRRRRGVDLHRWPLLVAAAAAVVALVVGVAVLRPGDDESQLDSAGEVDEPDGPDTPPSTDSPPTTDEQPTDTEPPEVTDGKEVAAELHAEEAATSWLTLLRAGDPEEAHARLDAPSRAALPLEEFRQVATGLAEGAGAFAAEGVTSDVLRVPDTTDTFVVVFHGEVEREGMVETAAYPVVVTGAGDEPGIAFSFAGPTIDLDEPSPGETRTSPVQVRVGSDQAWFSIDGGEPRPIGESPATIDVEGVAGAGTHVVTIVATDGELFTARSVTVVVP